MQQAAPRQRFNPLRWRTTDSAGGRFLLRVRTWGQLLVWNLRSPGPETRRLSRMILRIKPTFTMVTNANLAKLYELGAEISRENLPGDLVVCGVWNGGSSAMLARGAMDGQGQQEARAPWLFDSFEGLPAPTDKDGVSERSKALLQGLNLGFIEQVHKAFSILKAPLDPSRIVKGWFDSTLPGTPLEQIALLHIDADWYDSVRCVLEQLYDRVVPGGFIVLDDFGYWEGCDRAWEDFFKERKTTPPPLHTLRPHGAWCRKPV